MKPLPEQLVVESGKVGEYLLAPRHPVGGGKAKFFMRFGFRADAVEKLIEALAKHGRNNPVVEESESNFGCKWVVEGPLECPDGRNPIVRTVWIQNSGAQTARLVTALPIPPSRGRENDSRT